MTEFKVGDWVQFKKTEDFYVKLYNLPNGPFQISEVFVRDILPLYYAKGHFTGFLEFRLEAAEDPSKKEEKSDNPFIKVTKQLNSNEYVSSKNGVVYISGNLNKVHLNNNYFQVKDIPEIIEHLQLYKEAVEEITKEEE